MFRSRSSSHKLCPSFFVAAAIFSVFTLTGIVSAAWVDAPNEPPGYGASGCSPFPCLEEDFRPFNLSSTFQAKKAGASFEGSVIAQHFFDFDDTNYRIDPSSPSISMNLNGHAVVNADASFEGARLVVNNPIQTFPNPVKIGSTNDAIYAYANSAGVAVFAEQDDPTGYALYASGTTSHFDTNVEIGSAANPKQLCLGGVCQSSWPSAGSGTTNTITKWTGSNTLGNSIITDNGTTVGVSGNLNVTGSANTCKKVSYTYTQDPTLVDPSYPPDTTPPASTIPNVFCGVNYYVVAVMNTTDTLVDFGAVPTSGSMICCKNAD